MKVHMENSVLIGTLIGLSLLGLSLLIHRRRELTKRFNFTSEFQEKLHQYLNSHGKNEEAISWLIFHSVKMQKELGSYGRGTYIAPFRTYVQKDYQIILEGIPKIRNSLENRSHFVIDEIRNVDDTIVRYFGVLSEILEENWSQIKNPFMWFSSGVQLVLSLPIRLLGWFGILSNSIVSAFIYSRLFKALTGIASLITFLGVIVELMISWETFIEVINKMIS